jgi:hypothetical protein
VITTNEKEGGGGGGGEGAEKIGVTEERTGAITAKKKVRDQFLGIHKLFYTKEFPFSFFFSFFF